MNAGFRHSAVNFGSIPRIQLVVRQLLPNSLVNGTKITVMENDNVPEKNTRYVLDDILSPYLNRFCKNNYIGDVSIINNQNTKRPCGLTFILDNSKLSEFKDLVNDTKLLVTYYEHN
jgi:hypothetical protein